ncbi:alpha-lytic protease prodomain-containing protein [Streptosporangium carneum]|uniref:Serine protease n=1 Tax=Streptosporangium carneum TaxID=47481 RepID=A0A9W6IC52_9ACTN|nr:carbohydrate-binding protein [Streptosporangium carneum]GLK15453.1 serine protease [Streptosporangium carneum]
MLRRNAVAAGLTVAVTLVAAPAIAFATTGSSAADPLYPQAKAEAAAVVKPAPEMISALTRDLGITSEQASTRLVNESAAAKVEPIIGKQLGAAYGGAWVTGPTAELVVATSDSKQLTTILKTGAQAKLVKHSLATLDAAKAKLDQRAEAAAPKSVPAWYVDVRTNGVVVLANDVAAGQAFVDASGADKSLVKVEKSNEQPRTFYDLRGGDAYYIGSGSRCSIGFPVTRSGQGGFATAGHCGSTGASTSGSNRVAQGSFQGSSFPGNDYAWVSTNSNWTPRGVVVQNGATIPVNGSTVAQVGSSVCRSGSTTGWHCGSVQQLNTSVTYQEGTVSGVTRTSVCAEPGDSGGSFISGDQAQGVTSGGSGNCSSGGTTYFQPVNEILQTYGLTLVTSNGPQPTSTGNSPTPTQTAGGTWAAGTTYAAGATVTYGGSTYRCLQGHTAYPGWEPPNVPALWQRV